MLSERVHECPYCGFIADRDYNAAVNIHRVGMETAPQARGAKTSTSHLCGASVGHDSREAPPERRGVFHVSMNEISAG
ncbi:zinc ribbon domain-containing protein [Methanoculleus receptaculi]|uniref:Zinc ribbon domain-containing protein n=1 Tax=Methanoculleus receptaculi TaxID=394967 RepID=A0AAX4FXQ6_9EURY|nr:zinc ribbon domain-containing protein [Methanoculleus receptaculi]WOX58647.1 zinc ribbon domain-containing protein [Methanoculleus receptaculi]